MAASSENARWWEFYAIRYGMGAVVGGAIVFGLFKMNAQLQPLLFGADEGKLDGIQLIVLFGYGLTFCYLASAPILVLHAGRFLFWSTGNAAINQPQLQRTRAFLVYATGLIGLAGIGVATYKTNGAWLALAMVAIVLLSQCIIVAVFIGNHKFVFTQYESLAKKREEDKKSGLVESYRHLREHGNSFFIVGCEILLGMGLYATQSLQLSLKASSILLVAWFVPAAFVWLMATYLERDFMS